MKCWSVQISAGSGQSLWSYMLLSGEKMMSQLFSVSFDEIFVKLTGNKDRHKSSEWVRNWARSGYMYSLRGYSPFTWRKWCLHLFSVTLNSMSIKFKGNEDRHKILDKVELRPDLINHFCVTYPWVVWKKMIIHFQSDLLQTCLQLEQA